MDGNSVDTPLLWDEIDALRERLGRARPALFLDYDGTLTPIVNRPEDAALGEDVRVALRRAADVLPVVIVSGRDRPAVERFIAIDDLIYAGSHGFDIRGPGGMSREHDAGREHLPALDAAESMLQDELGGVPGAQVERKRYAIAIHYRNVDDADVPAVESAVHRARDAHRGLRRTGGKKVFELRPDVDWHKGRAVLWLLEAMRLGEGASTPIYVGDDETDEDAFRALSGIGIGIRVGAAEEETAANYRLEDVDDVRRFLVWVAGDRGEIPA